MGLQKNMDDVLTMMQKYEVEALWAYVVLCAPLLNENEH